MKPNCQTCIYPRLYRAYKALRDAVTPHEFHERLKLKAEIKELETLLPEDSKQDKLTV